MNDSLPISDVLLLRSEVGLAIKFCEEAGRARSSGIWIAAGGVGAVSAWIVVLWTLSYLLATRISMTHWSRLLS
jgi:hypothetical protein